MKIMCEIFGHKVKYIGIANTHRYQMCSRCDFVVKGSIYPIKIPTMPKCKPYKVPVDPRVVKIEEIVKLAERWCEDQENGMTSGSVCISAIKDIRRILKGEMDNE